LEEKGNRTRNLDILGDIFEAFLGAMFLDMNKIQVADEHDWFKNIFIVGPGFQMAQKFLESVFERHIDWTGLIQTNNNYKNQLQERIQKEFKVTPHYLEINADKDTGYTMGVYLCLGQPIHSVHFTNAIPVSGQGDLNEYPTFQSIIDHVAANKKIFVLLGVGTHKKKKKAEQQACEEALKFVIS
jgi:dsRNA-specific ribonuclease